jgi:hypothetical protein
MVGYSFTDLVLYKVMSSRASRDSITEQGMELRLIKDLLNNHYIRVRRMQPGEGAYCTVFVILKTLFPIALK